MFPNLRRLWLKQKNIGKYFYLVTLAGLFIGGWMDSKHIEGAFIGSMFANIGMSFLLFLPFQKWGKSSKPIDWRKVRNTINVVIIALLLFVMIHVGVSALASEVLNNYEMGGQVGGTVMNFIVALSVSLLATLAESSSQNNQNPVQQ